MKNNRDSKVKYPETYYQCIEQFHSPGLKEHALSSKTQKPRRGFVVVDLLIDVN